MDHKVEEYQYNKSEDQYKLFNKMNKDILTYAPAIIIPALLNVVSIMIFTRVFSAEEFGVYTIIASTLTLIATLISQWIMQSIQKYRPLYQAEKKLEFFNKYLLITIHITLIIASLAMLFIYLLGLIFKLEVSPYFILNLSLIVIFQALFLIGVTIYQSDLQSKKYRFFQLINAVLKFSLTIGLIFFLTKKIEIIFLGILISYLFTIILIYKDLKLPTKYYSEFYKDKEYIKFIKSFISYGFPMIGWFLGNSILSLSDRYMLGILRGSEEVGIYSANAQLVFVGLGLVCSPILSAAHPIIMKASNNKNDQIVQKIIKKFSTIFLLVIPPMLLYIALFKDIIVEILLGNPFREGSIIMPILLVGIFFWNFSMYGHKGHEIKGKTKLMFLFVVISGVVNIMVNLILIPEYGYVGAALATLIAYLTYPILIFISSKNTIPWVIPWITTRNVFISIFISFFVIKIIEFVVDIKVESIYINLIYLFIGCIVMFLIYFLNLVMLNEINIKSSKIVRVRK